MHVTNNTNEDILVIVSPNKDWLIGDLGFDIAKTIYSGGLNAVKAFTSFPKQVKNLTDLWKLIDAVKKVYGLSQISKIKKAGKIAEASEAARKQLEDLQKLVQSNSVRVKPGTTEVVNVKDIFGSILRIAGYLAIADGAIVGNPHITTTAFKEMKETKKWEDYKKDKQKMEEKTQEMGIGDIWDSAMGALNILNPSTFMSVFGFSADMSVMIVNSDLEKTALFKSNSNHAWVVGNEEIVRSKSDDRKTGDRSLGYKPFTRSRGNMLMPGEYLEPNDSLMIESSSANRRELNFKDPEPDPSDSLWTKITKGIGRVLNAKVRAKHNLAKNTVGPVMDIFLAKQHMLIYQKDGNLVLYENNGDSPTAVWSTRTHNRPAWRTCMQEDGNFCVYSKEGECEWALWYNPPASAKGGYIGLEPNNGKFAFYKEGTERIDFEVNNKKDTYHKA